MRQAQSASMLRAMSDRRPSLAFAFTVSLALVAGCASGSPSASRTSPGPGPTSPPTTVPSPGVSFATVTPRPSLAVDASLF